MEGSIRHEIQALEINSPWKLTQLHVCKKPISWKWVFKTKLKANGSVERYKFLLVYVDDVPITGPSMSPIQGMKTYLHELFSIKDIGGFFGLGNSKKYLRAYLAQTKYTLDVIKDTRLHNAKAVSTLFPQGLKLSTNCGAQLQQADAYRWLVGHLLYLGFSWPDISHFV
ncbi:UNVERIFIED_CONTAM: Retrovirus-related Pol polyprotein from transposon RE1 [Sesamum calycinum]|uniref:Retrovirus-related Pol polyprotein from transposon RE1 n=1 Tax=Sesamum calycinum TaxID=2727403 RepID=A0AAW2JD57_9LAMI